MGRLGSESPARERRIAAAARTASSWSTIRSRRRPTLLYDRSGSSGSQGGPSYSSSGWAGRTSRRSSAESLAIAAEEAPTYIDEGSMSVLTNQARREPAHGDPEPPPAPLDSPRNSGPPSTAEYRQMAPSVPARSGGPWTSRWSHLMLV